MPLGLFNPPAPPPLNFSADEQRRMMEMQWMVTAQQNLPINNLLYGENQRRAPQVVRRIATVGKSVTQLFFEIPAVKYLIEKIPAARVVIAQDGVTAAYLMEAKHLGLPLKKQCEDLGIPWTARLLTEGEVSVDAVKVASFLAPSVFSQSKPKERFTNWAARVLDVYESGCPEEVVTWAAWNVAALSGDDLDYLKSLKTIAPSTKPETVKERSREWHRSFHRRQQIASIGASESSRAILPEGFTGKALEFSDLTFKPLVTPDDFLDESHEMRHCISTRFHYAFGGTRFYFSISGGGKRLATAEYHLDGTLSEIKAFANAKPTSAVIDAAIAFSRSRLLTAASKQAQPPWRLTSTVPKPPEPPKPPKPEPHIQKLSFDASAWTGA